MDTLALLAELYPVPSLPMPLTSQDVDPLIFGPNITGQLNKSPTPWSGLLYEQNGALKPVNVGDTAYSGHTNGSNYRLEFDASWSNEAYGNSTTVQPPAMALLPCVKF